MSGNFEPSPLVELDETLEFNPWPKIPRGQHENITITEKMDGSNSCIIVKNSKIVGIQSRKRFISPGKETDNFGFARWVHENAEEVLKLGEGEHFGEWVGPGIQNNPHNLEERAFYLFNTFRWNPDHQPPELFKVVPVLFQGEKDKNTIKDAMDGLWTVETAAGNTPEGVIVYYHTTRRNEKHTFRDTRGKWVGNGTN